MEESRRDSLELQPYLHDTIVENLTSVFEELVKLDEEKYMRGLCSLRSRARSSLTDIVSEGPVMYILKAISKGRVKSSELSLKGNIRDLLTRDRLDEVAFGYRAHLLILLNTMYRLGVLSPTDSIGRLIEQMRKKEYLTELFLGVSEYVKRFAESYILDEKCK